MNGTRIDLGTGDADDDWADMTGFSNDLQRVAEVAWKISSPGRNGKAAGGLI
jgi:hypothetical protein